jgi:hypothetical protein
MNKPKAEIIEAEGFRLVKDGRTYAALEFDAELGGPVFRLFDENDIPAVHAGVIRDGAFVRVGAAAGEGCIRLERNSVGCVTFTIESTAGPAMAVILDSVGGRHLHVYDDNVAPLFSVGQRGAAVREMQKAKAPSTRKVVKRKGKGAG